MKVWVVIPHDGFSHPNLSEMHVFTKEPSTDIMNDEGLWVFDVVAED